MNRSIARKSSKSGAKAYFAVYGLELILFAVAGIALLSIFLIGGGANSLTYIVNHASGNSFFVSILAAVATHTQNILAATGGTLTPGNGWYPAGSTVNMGETPAAGYGFVGWVGTGSGSYTGNAPSTTVTPQGPITEIAYFTTTI